MSKLIGFGRPLVFPEPPAYTHGAGSDYARQLAEKGQRHSHRLTVYGWCLIIAAGLFAVLGTTARTEFEVEQDPDDKTIITLRSGASNWFNAHIGIICGACAIVFAGVGWQALDRATAAALLAAAATTALRHVASSKEEDADLKVYWMCLEAKAGWLEGRMNHDRISSIAQSLFGEGRNHRRRDALRSEQREAKSDDQAQGQSADVSP